MNTNQQNYKNMLKSVKAVQYTALY